MNQTLSPNRKLKGEGEKNLAGEITKAGSKQTYYTFLWLADRDQREEAFGAYAYFRWLDDQLDCASGTKEQKRKFLKDQMELLEACYRREQPGEVRPEEMLLVNLVKNDRGSNSGMQIYLRNMMAVMAFDVERCGRAITASELSEYTRLLSTAVTELLFYLIGHNDPPPSGDTRYHAVSGAHVVHMLRDMVEDIQMGYFNMPGEFFRDGTITSDVLQRPAFRKWVCGRAELAHEYFKAGREYIARVRNFRCRLAGFAYLARFEYMLKLIERDDYYLRAEYPERKGVKALAWMTWRVLSSVLNLPWVKSAHARQPFRSGSCKE